MRLFVDVMDYLELDGVSVSREDTHPANGSYDPTRRHIALGRHIDGDQATKTLVHEAAHHLAGHVASMDRQDMEAVAESAAFVVLSHYGIDSSGYSFPYVARWAKDRQILKRNLETIQQVGHRFIDSLEGQHDGRKGSHQAETARTVWTRGGRAH